MCLVSETKLHVGGLNLSSTWMYDRLKILSQHLEFISGLCMAGLLVYHRDVHFVCCGVTESVKNLQHLNVIVYSYVDSFVIHFWLK